MALVKPTFSQMSMERYAESTIPTDHGEWTIVVYRIAGEEHLALVYGRPGSEDVLCRVHSECLTGESFGSRRCDCRHQLDLAMAKIAAAGGGVVVYLRQEGRGIGIGNKIRAYALQDDGKDTAAANEALGFAVDQRTYEIAADILQNLKIASVRLLTNNPEKVKGLERGGIRVLRREPHWGDESEHNQAYLKAKRDVMGHLGDDIDAKESTKL